MADAPKWYKGSTSDWDSPEDPAHNLNQQLNAAKDPKAAVQNLLRATVGGGGAGMQDKPATDWTSFIKSLTTDAISQAPLVAISPGGTGRTLVRGAASLLAGTGADQLMNPERPLMDSMVDGGVNTAVGMAIPHVMANETKYTPPNIVGTGTSAPLLKLLGILNPSNYSSSPRTVIRGTTQGPKPVPSNIGIDLSNKLFTGTNGKVDLSPEAILNLFGFGANAGLDSTVNRPTK